MKNRTSKKTTSKPKKSIAKKPVKKTTKKTTTKKTTRTSTKKIQKKAAVAASKTPKAPKAPKAPKTTKIIKAKTDGMNDYEQCIVLAAIVNQQRNTDTRFLFTPLPDINSSVLAPLREILSQYCFTSNDIIKAAHQVFQSKKFQECFALHEPVKETLLKITQNNPNALIRELIKLAGPEAKKWIYMKEGHSSQDIHQTTLEKHALKLGLIEPHHIEAEPFQKQDHHRKIIIKLNFQNKGRGFHNNLMRFSGKQHRGRG